MRAMILAAAVLGAGWAIAAAPAEDATCCAADTLFLNSETTTAPASKVDAKKAFDEISQAVVGKWKLDVEKAKDKSFSGETEFKLTAGGSVIMETMLPGTKMEMVNLFALDKEDLLVTHYCAGGNQPRMKLTKVENGVYTFEFKDGTNIKPDGSYMGKLVLTLADGKVVEDWTHYAKGQPAGEMNLPLTRQ